MGFEVLDAGLMLRTVRGLLRWGDAGLGGSTGGYLLTACLASGRAAGAGAVAWFKPR